MENHITNGVLYLLNKEDTKYLYLEDNKVIYDGSKSDSYPCEMDILVYKDPSHIKDPYYEEFDWLYKFSEYRIAPICLKFSKDDYEKLSKNIGKIFDFTDIDKRSYAHAWITVENEEIHDIDFGSLFLLDFDDNERKIICTYNESECKINI